MGKSGDEKRDGHRESLERRFFGEEVAQAENQPVADPERVDAMARQEKDAVGKLLLFLETGVGEKNVVQREEQERDQEEDEPVTVLAGQVAKEKYRDERDQGVADVELGFQVVEEHVDLAPELQWSALGVDFFVLAAGEMAHEAGGGAGVAPIHRRIRGGGQWQIGVEREPENHGGVRGDYLAPHQHETGAFLPQQVQPDARADSVGQNPGRGKGPVMKQAVRGDDHFENAEDDHREDRHEQIATELAVREPDERRERDGEQDQRLVIGEAHAPKKCREIKPFAPLRFEAPAIEQHQRDHQEERVQRVGFGDYRLRPQRGREGQYQRGRHRAGEDHQVHDAFIQHALQETAPRRHYVPAL